MTDDWRDAAVCRDVDSDLFYPTGSTGPVYERQVHAAKQVCRGCPAIGECLAWALQNLPHGIAGGLTETERQARRAQAGLPKLAPLKVGNLLGTADHGRDAIRHGVSAGEAAKRFGVNLRTAHKWSSQVSAERGTS